jgi:hypothetical protein
MMGEITPLIAEIVASCDAHKVLLPVKSSHFEMIGLESQSFGQLIKGATSRVLQIVREREQSSSMS